jgi:predicted 3-demethylubiquinone-9 3-methyltransferase (glyoxalase superfamily)
MVSPVIPCLWFDDNAEEAINFYCSVIPNSEITDVYRFTDGVPDPEGKVLYIDFRLNGQQYQALNGGPMFPFTEAVSFVLECADQAEIDHYWDALIAGGGQPVECGWLKDRHGLSWQIVPQGFGEMMRQPDRRRAAQAMKALMSMVKLDIAALQAAFDAD